MKRFLSIFFLLFFVGCMAGLQAQKPRLSKEEFRERQREFITRHAGLTKEEADKFFPLYFELQDKKGARNREAWEKMRKGEEPGMSEAEYGQIIEEVVQARIANDKLDLEYVKKYRKFLSAKKIYDIQGAEMRFHRELLKGTPAREKKKWDALPGERPE